MSTTSTTRLTRLIPTRRARVYAALIDADALAHWRFPEGMTIRVHEFEPREGGSIRVSLTYLDPDLAGKSSEHTDTYHGRFERLVPDEQVVEVLEFETGVEDLAGTMRVSITLADEGPATRLTALHEGVPAGVRAADNERGWSEALDRLERLLLDG